MSKQFILILVLVFSQNLIAQQGLRNNPITEENEVIYDDFDYTDKWQDKPFGKVRKNEKDSLTVYVVIEKRYGNRVFPMYSSLWFISDQDSMSVTVYQVSFDTKKTRSYKKELVAHKAKVPIQIQVSDISLAYNYSYILVEVQNIKKANVPYLSKYRLKCHSKYVKE